MNSEQWTHNGKQTEKEGQPWCKRERDGQNMYKWSSARQLRRCGARARCQIENWIYFREQQQHKWKRKFKFHSKSMRKKNNNGIGWLLRNVQFWSILCGYRRVKQPTKMMQKKKESENGQAEIGFFFSRFSLLMLAVWSSFCVEVQNNVSACICVWMRPKLFWHSPATRSICVCVCVCEPNNNLTVCAILFCRFVFSSSFFRFNTGRWQKNVFYILVLFVCFFPACVHGRIVDCVRVCVMYIRFLYRFSHSRISRPDISRGVCGTEMQSKWHKSREQRFHSTQNTHNNGE